MTGRGDPTDRSNTPKPTRRKSRNGGDGGDPDSSSDECHISFATALQGLDAAVIKMLAIGTVLTVERYDGGRYPSIVCKEKKTHRIAGSLGATDKVPALLDCMDQGNVYEAKVTDLRSGCRVQVYRISKGTVS